MGKGQQQSQAGGTGVTATPEFLGLCASQHHCLRRREEVGGRVAAAPSAVMGRDPELLGALESAAQGLGVGGTVG